MNVLDESSNGQEGEEGYGAWVRHVHGQFCVDPTLEADYLKNVVRLLTLCASAQSMSWNITWGSRHSVEDSVSLRRSTVNILLLSQPLLQPTLSSLQTLSLSLDNETYQKDKNAKSTLTFDNPLRPAARSSASLLPQEPRVHLAHLHHAGPPTSHHQDPLIHHPLLPYRGRDHCPLYATGNAWRQTVLPRTRHAFDRQNPHKQAYAASSDTPPNQQ